VDAPAHVAAKARYALETLLSACAERPASVAYPSPSLPASEAAWEHFRGAGAARPALRADGALNFGGGRADLVASAFWHLSRFEERGAAGDRHGRFPAAAALADPERPAVDALLRRFAEAVGARAGGRFAVVLTHDVDVPWRFGRARAVVGAAARLRRAAVERRGRDAGAEALGLAVLPAQKLRRRDSNWTFERIAAIERAHGGRSTYFVMAAHRHPADGPDPRAYERRRARVVAQVLGQGDEVGLHPSYTTSDDHRRLAEEKALLEELAGRALVSCRFHYLRHRAHVELPAVDRLGFRVDSSQGYAERPGLRAGFSFPYRPYDLDADRPLALVEVPLAVMDATLAEPRYLGLSPREGFARARRVLDGVADIGGTVAVLWHIERFSRIYARGWDRVYADLLAHVRDRGGRLIAAEDVLAGPTP
jgi:hypothetical protein